MNDEQDNLFHDTETRRKSEQYIREPSFISAEQLLPAEPDLAAIEASIRHPLLAEREITHGNFAAVALIAQRFKDISKSTPNWSSALTDVQRESLEGIFTKIARILSGDPNYPDTWADIEGYAHLVTETLP